MPLLLLLPLLLQQHLLLLAGCLGGPKVEVDFPDERLFSQRCLAASRAWHAAAIGIGEPRSGVVPASRAVRQPAFDVVIALVSGTTLSPQIPDPKTFSCPLRGPRAIR